MRGVVAVVISQFKKQETQGGKFVYSTDAGAAAAVLRGRERESWGGEVFLRNPSLQNSQQHRHTGCTQGEQSWAPLLRTTQGTQAEKLKSHLYWKVLLQQCCGHTEGG